MRPMLQNQLLQIVKGLPVISSLPHLHQRTPVILSLGAMASIAHLMLDVVFYNKGLLEHCPADDFSLDR